MSGNSNDNTRIDTLEKDLKDLKTNVESTSQGMTKAVDELRKVVVDIRSAVSEIENPFNLLRVITNEQDLERVNRSAPSLVQKGLLRKEYAPSVGEPKEVEPAQVEERKVEVSSEIRKEADTHIGFKHSSSLVRWIYTMLDLGFDEESLRKLCEFCEYFGLIPKGSNTHVSNMVGTVVEAVARGITEDELILSSYAAAEALGAQVDGGNLLSVSLQALRRSKQDQKRMVGQWDSQQQSQKS